MNIDKVYWIFEEEYQSSEVLGKYDQRANPGDINLVLACTRAPSLCLSSARHVFAGRKLKHRDEV
jgi:hypothetical protein